MVRAQRLLAPTTVYIGLYDMTPNLQLIQCVFKLLYAITIRYYTEDRFRKCNAVRNPRGLSP